MSDMAERKVVSTSAHPVKRTVPKKSPGVSKSVPKKAVTKRAVKKVAQNTVKKAVKKTVAEAAATERVVTEPTLVLPINMSLRAKAKVSAIMATAMVDFNKPARQIAYVGGLCFVMFGAFVATAASGTWSDPAGQMAQLASSTLDTQTTTTATYPVPTFTLYDSVPAILKSVSQHSVLVTNAQNVSARIYSLKDGTTKSLNLENLQEGRYQFSLDPTKLGPGKYAVNIVAESVYDQSKRSFKAGEFEVLATAVVQTSTTTTSTAATTSTNTTTAVDTNTTAGTASTDSTSVDTATAETSTTTTTETETVDDTATGETFKVSADGSEVSGTVPVKIYAPTDVRYIEFYVRPLKSTGLLFTGLAEKRTGYWIYFLNTSNLPNGDYELIAHTRSNDKFLESESDKVRVANLYKTPALAVPITEPETTTESSDEPSIQPPPPTTFVPDPNARIFSETTISDEDKTSLNSVESAKYVKEEIDSILSDYHDELEQLLKRYSVAQQSKDPVLIEIARNEFLTSKEKLIDEILNDPLINHLADDINRELTDRLMALQKRVDTFEELRRTATEGSTSVDNDGDGISDFDEKNLYNTDPDQADSDNDGVIDGVEVMRGFDPLDSAAEAVIEYELPQDSPSLVQEELLAIETVVPFVKTEVEGETDVQAEIRGRALPNSFVTLYIFSTPTIVTVRTDEDGSFVYTFEKELEDGEHEVYVAVTDNTGSIVAKSNPFRFVKQAEAFTPVSAASSEVVTNQTFAEFTAQNSYNIVAGFGILALGLILLMLGVNLREQESIKTQEAKA